MHRRVKYSVCFPAVVWGTCRAAISSSSSCLGGPLGLTGTHLVCTLFVCVHECVCVCVHIVVCVFERLRVPVCMHVFSVFSELRPLKNFKKFSRRHDALPSFPLYHYDTICFLHLITPFSPHSLPYLVFLRREPWSSCW